LNIPVFVINLKRSQDRREHTIRQLEKWKILFQFIEAFDGEQFSEQEIRENPDYGIYKSGLYSRYLRKEEIGCTLSHLYVYKRMVDEKIKLACILEDDNDYSPDFKNILYDTNLITTRWDILYLGHRSGSTQKEAQCINTRKLLQSGFSIGEAIEVPHGSHAYIIKIEAAKKLIDHAFPVKTPFDLYIGNSAALGIHISLLKPVCISTNSSFLSTIQDEENIILETSFWRTIRMKIKKCKLLFNALKGLINCFKTSQSSFLRYLRKTGFIDNNYARL